jgi:hypothetical protein
MAVHDELMARLATVGASAVFDIETLPDSYTSGANPYLILQDISSTPETAIDGAIYANSERWQVSVRGKKLHAVRTMAQAVIASLHGFTSESIARADYEVWPGTIPEGTGSAREFHAPVDFMIWRNN